MKDILSLYAMLFQVLFGIQLIRLRDADYSYGACFNNEALGIEVAQLKETEVDDTIRICRLRAYGSDPEPRERSRQNAKFS